jgi:hypothetical protein
MKKIVLKIFSGQARFMKECFLSFMNFEPNEILDYLPYVQKIQYKIMQTEINKHATNKIDA